VQTYLEDSNVVPWSFPIRILEKSQSATDIVKRMKIEYGVECRNGFIAASMLKYFDAKPLENSEALSREVVSLPLYSGMTEHDSDAVCEALINCL
jgi:dTDP-4-amino-4,6-dideoxygalactose transaminase